MGVVNRHGPIDRLSAYAAPCEHVAVHPATRSAYWNGTRTELERSVGLHPEAYTDASFHAVEQQRVFERGWVAVATAPELATPGRLLVRRVGGRSILAVRGHDGVLRGFLNACRHRGTELAEADCDAAGTIRCPYHRWTYRLDGALVATPQFESVPRDRFDPDEYGLVPVRVETWGVLVFACLAPEGPTLETWLGDLPERMAGYGLDGWTLQEERSLDIDANWKLISENYQEYYHLGWVHPELARVSRVRDHYRYQGPGMYCGQTTTPVSGDDRDDWLRLPPADGLDASDRVSGRFVAIFPNVLLSVLPNHVFVMRLEPIGPGRTREHCTFLLPPSTPTISHADLAPTRTFWFDVNAQDIDIVERAQRGLSRGAVAPGPLSPRFEEPLHRFHNMLADLMAADSIVDGIRIPEGDGPEPEARLGTAPNPVPPTIDSAPTGGGPR